MKFFRFILAVVLVSSACLKTANAPSKTASGPVVDMVYFYSPDCGICEEIRDKVFPEVERELGLTLRVTYLNTDEGDNIRKVLFLETKTGIQNPGFPVLFLGDTSLFGEEDIKGKIRPTLRSLLERKVPASQAADWLKLYAPANVAPSTAASRLGFLPVAISGLLDGVNPCAFSTLIFLLSFLFFVKMEKRAIFLTGVFYTLGVFLTYLGAGVGFFKVLKVLTAYKAAALTIKWASIALLALVAVLSLVDTVRYLVTRKTDFILRMSDRIKQKVHEAVRTRVAQRTFFLSAFVLGVILSFFELACTGQIYLPTILYILQVPSMKLRGFAYLLLYNVMFILPLLAVFLIAWMGVTSKNIEGFFRKHLLLLKILTTLLFGFLLVMVLLQKVV
jgi:hypothetical protein